jgi:hypothetical protein
MVARFSTPPQSLRDASPVARLTNALYLYHAPAFCVAVTFLSLCGTVLAAGTVDSDATGPHDTADDGRALYMLIAAEQQKSLDKLPPLRWSSFQSTKVLSPGHEREHTNERRMIRKENCAWSEIKVCWRRRDGKPGWEEAIRVVLWNDRYVAEWPARGSPLAYIWEYDSLENMSEAARRAKEGTGIRPELRCAYGEMSMTLAEFANDARTSSFRYEVTREGEPRDRYLVKAFWANQPHPRVELTVDPKRGFMITKRVMRDGIAGWTMQEISVEGREILPGVWFPVRWDETGYSEPDSRTGKQAITRIHHFEIIEVEPNPDIPDSQFEWPALDLEATTEVWRYDVSGEREAMRISNSELVPVPLIPKLDY